MAEEAAAALESASGGWDWSMGVGYNSALVFVKPHAVNEKTTAFVKAQLEAKNLRIDYEGSIGSNAIEAGGIIDKHYAAIAHHAMAVAPDDLNIPDPKKTEFAETFETPWHTALQSGTLMNAGKAMETMSADGKGLGAVWDAAPTKLKLAPGLYVAKCCYVMGENEDGDEVGVPAEPGTDGAFDIFVINGFYGAMRQMFVTEGAVVHYFVVGFPSNEVTWKDFRDNIIGATDPASAAAQSIRGQLLNKWEALGMSGEPTVSLNGVHASAGPLEGLKERMVWLGLTPDSDPFGQKLLEMVWGGKETELTKLLENPVVDFAGQQCPVFDLTENKESIEVLCIVNNLTFASKDEVIDWYGAPEEEKGSEAEGNDGAAAEE